MQSRTDNRPEYPELRVFNVHPGMAKSSVLRPELEIYAKDTREPLFRIVDYPY